MSDARRAAWQRLYPFSNNWTREELFNAGFDAGITRALELIRNAANSWQQKLPSVETGSIAVTTQTGKGAGSQQACNLRSTSGVPAPKDMCVVCLASPVCPEDGQDTCDFCAGRV